MSSFPSASSNRWFKNWKKQVNMAIIDWRNTERSRWSTSNSSCWIVFNYIRHCLRIWTFVMWLQLGNMSNHTHTPDLHWWKSFSFMFVPVVRMDSGSSTWKWDQIHLVSYHLHVHRGFFLHFIILFSVFPHELLSTSINYSSSSLLYILHRNIRYYSHLPRDPKFVTFLNTMSSIYVSWSGSDDFTRVSLTVSSNKHLFAHFSLFAERDVYSVISKTSISFTVNFSAPVKQFSTMVSFTYTRSPHLVPIWVKLFVFVLQLSETRMQAVNIGPYAESQ
jgi:hypothetical protein